MQENSALKAAQSLAIRLYSGSQEPPPSDELAPPFEPVLVAVDPAKSDGTEVGGSELDTVAPRTPVAVSTTPAGVN